MSPPRTHEPVCSSIVPAAFANLYGFELTFARTPYVPSTTLERFLKGQTVDGVPGLTVTSPYNLSLLDNVARLKLDVQRIIPVHYAADNRIVTMAEVRRVSGRN
jgi:hypothetical protein